MRKRVFSPDAMNEDRKLEQDLQFQEKLNMERAAFERKNHENVTILFINIGLGKQKTAQNFWVHLSEPLSLEEIHRKIKVAFA